MMLSLLKLAAAIVLLLADECHSMASFILPAETSHHAGTIMTWPTTSSITTPDWPYHGANVSKTREELANLARTISKYETVTLFVRDPKTYDLNGDSGFDSAHHLLGNESNINILVTPNCDSLWARDNGAIFVHTRDGKPVENLWGPHDNPGVGFKRVDTSSTVVGMLLSFNQWGRKLPPSPESYIAATSCQALKISSVLAPFVGEGGAIEVDGEGTMIATESSLLNPNRNPGMDKSTLERHLSYAFGIKKNIWIPGYRGYDITDDHIDSLVRFTDQPGIVLLSKAFVPANATEDKRRNTLSDYLSAKEILENATDAQGRQLKTVTVPEPDPAKVLGSDYFPQSGPSMAYVNFHVVNGAVIMSKFGDEGADTEAARIIEEHFPGRKVDQLYTHQIAIQGGGFHCSTQQYYL